MSCHILDYQQSVERANKEMRYMVGAHRRKRISKNNTLTHIHLSRTPEFRQFRLSISSNEKMLKSLNVWQLWKSSMLDAHSRKRLEWKIWHGERKEKHIYLPLLILIRISLANHSRFHRQHSIDETTLHVSTSLACGSVVAVDLAFRYLYRMYIARWCNDGKKYWYRNWISVTSRTHIKFSFSVCFSFDQFFSRKFVLICTKLMRFDSFFLPLKILFSRFAIFCSTSSNFCWSSSMVSNEWSCCIIESTKCDGAKFPASSSGDLYWISNKTITFINRKRSNIIKCEPKI